MISVAEALEQVLSLVCTLDSEDVPLRRAAGRVLSRPVAARRSQPPFRSSAMDGYAVAAAEPGARLRVLGEAAAGRGWRGVVGSGEAVRIFTGAPVPEGATRVVMQEDVTVDGDRITIGSTVDPSSHVREAGADFASGEQLSQRRLGSADVALLAAMNIPDVPVVRRPVIALVATGDELVMPGEDPGTDQIIASNAFGLAAMLEQAGAEPRMLPVARDDARALGYVLGHAEDADLVVTIGGASVGDHDIVAEVAAAQGLQPVFHKVAMRPGKPLMAGRLGAAAMLGVPGNPVSAMVCGLVFGVPMVRAMLGLARGPVPRRRAPLVTPLGQNGPREHYMRACLSEDGLVVAERQDSALLSVLAQADALVVRPAYDQPRVRGDVVEYVAWP